MNKVNVFTLRETPVAPGPRFMHRMHLTCFDIFEAKNRKRRHGFIRRLSGQSRLGSGEPVLRASSSLYPRVRSFLWLQKVAVQPPPYF